MFLAVTALNASSLITGDGRTADDFAAAVAPGITVVGVVASLLTAVVAGFIAACAATSHSPSLRSITAWRVPLRVVGFVVRAALFTLLVVAVGEEPGWRGWMLPEVQKRYSPLVSSILVGVTWGF